MAEEKSAVSTPSPPSSASTPWPENSVSSPAPPTKLSLPPPPWRKLATPLPMSVSFPVLPMACSTSESVSSAAGSSARGIVHLGEAAVEVDQDIAGRPVVAQDVLPVAAVDDVVAGPAQERVVAARRR